MNDEIKEILNNLKNKDNDIKGINFLKYQDLTRGEINLLLDYITNLQQENESNINRIHELEQEIDSEYIQKEYYKSRCEKAIEYLKKCYNQPENIENFMTESEMNYLLNILQNGSDSQ